MELAPIPISQGSARGAYQAARARRIAGIKFMGLEVNGEIEAAPWGRPASPAPDGFFAIVFRVIGRLVAARP